MPIDSAETTPAGAPATDPPRADSGDRLPVRPPAARSLKFKFTGIIVALLALTAGVAPWAAIEVQKSQLLDAAKERLSGLHGMVESVIDTSMLSGSRDAIQQTMQATRSHRDIYRLRVLDPEGMVRFSSDPTEIGQQLRANELRPYIGHPDPIIQESEAGVSYTLVRPLFNHERCHRCHGDIKKVLGLLEVSLSLDHVWDQLTVLRKSAVLATLITLGVVAIGIWLSLTMFIDRPLHDLVDVMARIETGDLRARARVRSSDEIGQLGKRLNQMITELQSAQQELQLYHQEQLARADRLATIGEMAAAIAHEIRNPLTGIRGVLSVMSRGFPDDDPRLGIVAQTQQLIDRLNKSVEDILKYARPSHPRMRPVHFEEIVQPTLALLDGEARKAGVALDSEAEEGSDRLTIRADPHQIQQVLVNLVINAIHATPSGGSVRVRTGPGDDGRGVIEVADNGKGMSADQMAKAFQPFFSTKAQGTGLGLAIARQIVESHGGHIDIKSRPGAGTRVVVDLPVDSPEVSEAS